MAYNTFRSKDMAAERELAKFLDEHLYTKDIFTRADRTDSAITQIEGSDIIISIPSLNIKDAVVDEKASIYYINKNLQTFVLELSFLNKGFHYSDGWFVDKSLATEYYLMQWIKADVADPWTVTAQNITEIECVLISKQKLIDYFKGFGYDSSKFKEISDQIRKTGIYPKTPTTDFRFYYSPKLAEKPVNILLNKSVYIQLGEFHYFVKP